MSQQDCAYHLFGRYVSLLSFFHLSECLTIAVVNPRSLKTDSFLLNHSPEYHLAALCSLVEFALEVYFFPAFKSYLSSISNFGLFLALSGEFVRKLAMITAGTNFSHKVEFRKQKGHVLITHGVYSLWRHPSYLGWFVWSIGTQVVLVNPVCLIGYTIASYYFFKTRIQEEEGILIEFFGDEYRDYMRKVPPGIPFLGLDESQITVVREHVQEDQRQDM